MAEPENNKPKTEKTSASVVSTLPRLCPTTKLDFKDTVYDIQKPKSRSPGSRSVPNEHRANSHFKEKSKINLHKSKLTEFKTTSRSNFTSNSSINLISPRNYRGQIPVFHRHSLNLLRMSPPVTRSPSPVKKVLPREKPSNKIKTITFDQDTKKKTKTGAGSRSPSPKRGASGSYKQTKSTRGSSPTTGTCKTPGVRFADTGKEMTSPRSNFSAKRKSKSKVLSSTNVDLSSKGTEKGSQRQKADPNSIILKQASQPSLCKKDKLIQPQEKISLDHLKNEVYSGDHKRLSFEKVHLRIEKSVENLSLGERKRSYLVTYSSEGMEKEEGISLAFLQNLSSSSVTTFSAEAERKRAQGIAESKSAIRTLSGHELILTPSMNLDLEKSEGGGCEDIEISELLHESGETFEESKEVLILQDDANEYDSEVSTDGEAARQRQRHSGLRVSGSKCGEVQRKTGNSVWKSREADLLNDVHYRQSVYHPAVSRRHKDEEAERESGRPKSKSNEGNFGFSGNAAEKISRSHSSNLKNKYTHQNKNNKNDRSWASSFDKSNVIPGVPLYGTKRIRTKKERVSGALLRFTLKIIRLLAIFNLWPGDNCHMLTSQSLRFAR